jgi:hypothetical protein
MDGEAVDIRFAKGRPVQPDGPLVENAFVRQDFRVVDDRLPAAMTLYREVGITDTDDAVDTGTVGHFLCRVQQRFFEITAGAECVNDRERHRKTLYVDVHGDFRHGHLLRLAEGTTDVPK